MLKLTFSLGGRLKPVEVDCVCIEEREVTD
jgi:hypothetical protein